jgi:hypothetical protein
MPAEFFLDVLVERMVAKVDETVNLYIDLSGGDDLIITPDRELDDIIIRKRGENGPVGDIVSSAGPVAILSPIQIQKECVMSQKVLVYVDGSCRRNPGPGGWAALSASPCLNYYPCQ